MKKLLLIITFVILLVGCDEDMSIEYSALSTSKDFDSLDVYFGLENHTSETVHIDVHLEIEDHWLNEKISDKATVKKNGNVVDHQEFLLKPESINRFNFNYDWVVSVDRFEIKRDLYYKPLQIPVISNGEVLATESISEIRVFDFSNGQQSDQRFWLFIPLIMIVGIIVLIEKRIRKWLGVEKIQKEDQPKLYRRVNNGSNVMMSFLPIFWLHQSVHFILILYLVLVIIGFILQFILDWIYFRQTREYQVTIINGAVIVLFLALFIQYYPYIMYR